ncbi:MAG TPA: hypothetical protein PKI93_07570 [Alphaproteobacteria bacterium]|nr:hypothetical protein [Alphaproteobacteria bacterium]
MSRIVKILSPFCLLALAACSTAIEGSQQQVAFTTTGAVDAVCEVRTGANDRIYKIRPPETIWVNKSVKDMTVTCNAPGNRTVTKTVEAEIAATTFLNPVTGLVPGALYDGSSGAMFKYPETIDVDFSGVMASMSPMPSYHNLDGLDPDRVAGVEDYGPDTPKAADDDALALRHKLAADKDAKEEAAAAALAAEKQARIDSLEGGFYGDKGKTK